VLVMDDGTNRLAAAVVSALSSAPLPEPVAGYRRRWYLKHRDEQIARVKAYRAFLKRWRPGQSREGED
jgi:hypothetical protein